ncbi:hypothetical protein PM10SUCC1_29090 [Propionigenium maris DSM 9537]|uniref:Uncharacterized protein n=1 Tax=Propionigenium maris DSM 9537 TaxID=1123000 RepID=A0A9W6LPU9_9FUSO|nr:hypothetical protein [Propionigenium maris]GLI57395.1 hypothetical protein PM10SUCC1_29090 [Propionigenium maris DSM 9537]
MSLFKKILKKGKKQTNTLKLQESLRIERLEVAAEELMIKINSLEEREDALYKKELEQLEEKCFLLSKKMDSLNETLEKVE